VPIDVHERADGGVQQREGCDRHRDDEGGDDRVLNRGLPLVALEILEA